MTMGSVEVRFRLETRSRQDGEVWVTWCPALDLYTQSETKESSHEAIKEAVLGWVESCLERKVLEAALEEVGFSPVINGQQISAGTGTNLIEIGNLTPQASAEFLDEVEISIPAYMCAAMGQLNAPR